MPGQCDSGHSAVMTETAPHLEVRNDMLRIALATVLNVVPYAMLAPQVIVRLGEAGASATAVSIYGLAPFALIPAMSGCTPRVLKRLGLKTGHLAGLSLAALALLATSALLVADWIGLIARASDRRSND